MAREIVKATIPSENALTTTHTLGAGWGDEAGKVVTVERTAARTSKGNDTHVAWPSVLGGFVTACGLDAHGRRHHSVWSIAPAPITCEVCNGTKGKGRGGKPNEHMQATAQRFAELAAERRAAKVR